MGGFAADGVETSALRMAGEYLVLPQLSVSASAAVARTTSHDEGDSFSHGGFTGPSLRSRYSAPLKPHLQLGVGVGFTPALGAGRIKPTLTGIESARRPYEYTSLGAAELVVDAASHLSDWTIRGEVGTYLVTDDGAQWGGVHVAAGAAYRASAYALSVVVHALLAPSTAREPLYNGVNDRVEARTYFGAEASVARDVGVGVALRAVLWKPFGYDSADASESATSVGVGLQVQL